MSEELWTVEVEPEVRNWLDNLSDRDYLAAEHAIERLLDAPTTLGEPYARHLGDGLRELRFIFGHDSNHIRITYWLGPDRRIVLPTVFRKTKMRETAEVDRTHQLKKTCETGHDPAPAHEVFTRNVMEGEGR